MNDEPGTRPVSSDALKWLNVLRTRGVGPAVREAFQVGMYRAVLAGFDRKFDRILGAETSRKVPVEELQPIGLHGRYGVEYAPTPGLLFLLMMNSLPKDLSGFSFVDLGSGKGRVLCLASLFNFDYVIGIEFSEKLHEVALMNINSISTTGITRCKSITSLLMDVVEYNLPGNNCVIYMYNPFSAELVDVVAQKIKCSIISNPRKIYVIYYNPRHATSLDRLDILRPVRRSPLCFLTCKLASPHNLQIYETFVT